MEIIVGNEYRNTHSNAVARVLHVGRRTAHDDGNNLVVTVVDVAKLDMAAANWSAVTFNSNWVPWEAEPCRCSQGCGCDGGD